MKNIIFLNYNIKVNQIYKNNDYFYFFLNNNKYFIKVVNSDSYVNQIFNFTNELYKNGIKVNTIVLNKDNTCCVKWKTKYIDLLKGNDIEANISINELKKYNVDSNLQLMNPMVEWKKEVDTLESELTEYNKEYPIIRNSFDYFIGMAENAIQLLGDIKADISFISKSIGHQVGYELFDGYNINDPFTFIKANRSYDLSNYFKFLFFKDRLDYNELELCVNELSDKEKIYFFACLLYPNYYFELIKRILLNKEKENKIECFIKKNEKYRELLSYCQSLVKKSGKIAFVNWINK